MLGRQTHRVSFVILPFEIAPLLPMNSLSADQAFAAALQHHQAGQLAQAEQGYRQVLTVDGNHADAIHFLGVIAMQTGNLEAALQLVERSIELRPDGSVYHNNLGQILSRLGRSEDAEHAYSKAIELDSEYAEAFNNLGCLQQGRGDLQVAEQTLREAIRINPKYAEPHTNLGNLHKDRGELDEAIESYRRAVAMNPGQSFVHSNLLLTLHYHPDYSPADLKREHDAWAARHVAPLALIRHQAENDSTPDRRLKIGYVSADFREHAVARFMLPVLDMHDRDAFEIYAYADVARPDAVTQLLHSLVAEWRDISSLDDTGLASLVRQDGIDILVDLSAHSGRNRLLAFALKPAPVQITWLAYCSTTGVDAIDYRLTDPWLDPAGTDLSNYSEQSVYLPHCYWCYSRPTLPASTHQRRLEPERAPVFGCLNNFAKVTKPVLELWATVLQRVPEAQLIIHAAEGSHRERALETMRSRGIDERRLEFISRQSMSEYFDTWRRIDVALDPFPWCGGTTTCDALWMGVPVVTLAGSTAVSRAGQSLLTNIGLERLVAHTPKQYVDIAVDLIENNADLEKLHDELRGMLEASPIMDSQMFTRDLEACYRGVWKIWCDKLSGD